MAGRQQYGWCRQSRVAVSRPVQLLLLAGLLLAANDSVRSPGLDYTKVCPYCNKLFLGVDSM